jgi:hypothetical protein
MNRFVFQKEGKPFFPVGAQVHNSSGFHTAELSRAFRALEIINANTVAIPVYWNMVEPAENEFCFDEVGRIVKAVRDKGYSLILLWFGTWKNGGFEYVPEWVKKDRTRFERVKNGLGMDLAVLSSFCANNLEADKKAFCEFVSFIKGIDEKDRTVIGIQVENEAGIASGCTRDYSGRAEEMYKGNVPEELIRSIADTAEGFVYRVWLQNGKRINRSWEETFGKYGAEYFSAFSIAGYIEEIARGGKEIYDIPMYTNVWLDGTEWDIPGLSYPSGAAVSKALDIYKYAAKHLDLIAPDIYLSDIDDYRSCCLTYSREDNPLFVPESGPSEWNSRFLFEAVANYDATGYFLFGAEGILNERDEADPACYHIINSLTALRAVSDILPQYLYTNRMKAINQSEYAKVQRFEFANYLVMAVFVHCHACVGTNDTSWNWQDHYHKYYRNNNQTCEQRGRGLIIETGPREFIACGCDYRLLFIDRRNINPHIANHIMSERMIATSAEYLSIEEGEFIDGSFITKRRRSGDESDFGVWVQADIGAVRVRLNE